jgi:hypothetical protein
MMAIASVYALRASADGSLHPSFVLDSGQRGGRCGRQPWRWQSDAAQILARDRGCNVLIAAGPCSRRVRARKASRCPSLARLWLPARLSSARAGRAIHATLPVWRWAILFRRTALFPRSVERRQFRSVLDLDADRTDVELRIRRQQQFWPCRLCVGLKLFRTVKPLDRQGQ